jgi:GNAT superfamily N-acetyltransferase
VGLDQAAIEGLRAMILAGHVGQLAVDDLRTSEVAGLAWWGNPAHLRSVAAALERAARGLEDYLVVRAPGGQPVAKMRVDYASENDTGVFSQLVTMSPLQGLGIATMLIGAGAARPRQGPGLRRARRRRRQPAGTPSLPAARVPAGRPPARIMGNRRR